LPNVSLIHSLKDTMKDAVLELITSYENTISSVEGLIDTSYQATASNIGLDDLDEARESLIYDLQQTLAKNCSLRRKDFNKLMEQVLSAYQTRKKEIEEERKLTQEILRRHLDEQKQLMYSARKSLTRFSQEDGNRDTLGGIVSELKAATQDRGAQVLDQLRCFQMRLDVFRREQEEINHKMQRLVNRGASLKLEDLRQIEAARERHGRKVQTEMRREDVARLLAHFSQQRHRRVRHGAA